MLIIEQKDYAPFTSTEHSKQLPPPEPELPSSDQCYPVRENCQPPSRYTEDQHCDTLLIVCSISCCEFAFRVELNIVCCISLVIVRA